MRIRQGSPDAGAPQRNPLAIPGQWQAQELRQASQGFLLPVGTSWVQRDVLGVAEEVHRLWPNLRVASCGCGHCLVRGHYPHVVLEACADNVTRPVFGVQRLTAEVIDRLHAIHSDQNPAAAHVRHNEVLRKRFQAEADAARQEALEEPIAALKDTRSTWRGSNGKVYSPQGVRKAMTYHA